MSNCAQQSCVSNVFALYFPGGKSLSELRQLYFRIKDEIFAKGRYGFGWDSDAYEELLQQYLDPKMKLMDVKHPR